MATRPRKNADAAAARRAERQAVGRRAAELREKMSTAERAEEEQRLAAEVAEFIAAGKVKTCPSGGFFRLPWGRMSDITNS